GKDFFRVHESYNGESYIPHANHPIEMTSDMKPGEASKSLSRHNKLVELIGGKVNEIDVEAARRIFRTYPILKNYQTDPNFPTLESVVIELDPANPRISIAAGPPDIFKYSTFDFQNGYVGTET
ncbi:unnamed protein product, partial [marine sediment metagenome]